jgi:hypothetical protein
MSLQNELRVSELISSGSSAISENEKGDYTFYVKPTNEDFDGETAGYVEKPKYNEEQLKKAVDVKLNELILPAAKEQPKVVPQKVYDRLQATYDASLATNSDLQKQIDDLTAEVETLTTANEALSTQMDVEKLLRASAENELEITNQKYVSLVRDFQNALSKGIREGIERVSLEAQIRGLQAEKETFNELQNSLQNQVNTQSSNLRDLQSQLTNAQQLQAAAQQQTASAQGDAAAARNAAVQAQLAGKKSGKIICDLLYRQGFIPENIWLADEAYGSMMIKTNRPVAIGYLIWARSVVSFLTKNPQYSKYVYIGVKPWSEHMAYKMGVLPKDNLVGKVINFFGTQFSLGAYKFWKYKREHKLNQLSLLWQ